VWIGVLIATLAVGTSSCGGQDAEGPAGSEASSALATARSVLDALERRDARGILGLVAGQPEGPPSYFDVSGMQETLDHLEGVELVLATDVATLEGGERDASVAVAVRLRRVGQDGRTALAGFTLERAGSVWKVNRASMKTLLLRAWDVASGTTWADRQTDTIGRAVVQAIRVWMRDKGGSPPASLEELLSEDDSGDGYLSMVPGDGWGRPFVYRVLPDGSFLLRSAGPDGEHETDDDVRFP